MASQKCPVSQGSAPHRTLLNEFYRVAFRKKTYQSFEQLSGDVDGCLTEFNERPHQGRWCFGKTPVQPWHGSIYVAKKKDAIGDGGKAA